ncbi:MULTISPECIES: GNAT family N-acetyltransferase [unclassified Bacillus (in: firmicutes)]|uniref:GNAT family N-acetyltransferase n=1 Tax=unclassified Bacillus (in: firmicutes) TaxID=185979 RepID=UPI0008E286A3|nr:MULTISPECIES: GNAT family N-acetyltransferase [unclassified Bacillus (in: firmicutes)]SFB06800.1 Protein N-acetyltransferase, RimJ/RimL family [Bacillus sp. UNCCL13]SFQ87571.1 Protein N-acetyltransferase, RimJ/RimL family [Bacillus sp. cl95]
MKIAETERLIVRLLTEKDAEFILELLNEPSWIKYIGDKGVRNIDDARKYIVEGPMAMYGQFGFGLYLVETKDDETPVGICGLIKRESLENVDIGFAFLERYGSKGFAYEAATAVMEYGRNHLHLHRIVAITTEDNEKSAKLLEKIGLTFEKLIPSHDGEETLKLFAVEY